MGSEWGRKTLGDVIELKRGYDLPKKSRVAGSIPLVSSAGVSDFHNEAKVKGPGVVTGRYGTIGEVFYSEEDFWPLNTTLYVRDFKGNDEKFIYYFLKTIDYLQYSDKAAVPGVNRNHLHMAEVFFPEDVATQKKIAEILGTIDNKIALNRQINTTLESMAQALFKSWFVDFDPVIDNALAAGNEIPDELAARAARREALRQQTNKTTGATDAASSEEALPETGLSEQRLPPEIQQLFPDRFVLTEEMGWVPEGCEITTIGDAVETTGGGTPSTKNPDFWEGGVHPFCTPKDMSQLTSWVLMDTERHLTDDGVNKISSGQLPKGTVLMSSRAPIGYLAISDVPVSVNQGVIALLPNTVFGPLYLLNWLHANLGAIMDRANGSTFLEISKKNFRPIPFLIPSYDVAKAFNEQAKAIQQKLLLLAEETVSLTNLRDSLLPKLLSGQITIPDA